MTTIPSSWIDKLERCNPERSTARKLLEGLYAHGFGHGTPESDCGKLYINRIGDVIFIRFLYDVVDETISVVLHCDKDQIFYSILSPTINVDNVKMSIDDVIATFEDLKKIEHLRNMICYASLCEN
jgi:hypothetical protein